MTSEPSPDITTVIAGADRPLVWTTGPVGVAQLERSGWRILRHDQFARRVHRLRTAGAGRSQLSNPAASLLGEMAAGPRLALVQARITDVDDLRVVYGYLVEPALRRGTAVLVAADRALDGPGLDACLDPEWGYPWTLERLRHLARSTAMPPVRPVAGVPCRRRWWRRLFCRGDTLPAPPPIPTAPRLDPAQRAAVLAGDGVVQIIAPAGSGKTTVLIERVRELQARGTPPGRIICLSFNRDARAEIGARLEAAGLAGVEARSFHGLGLRILKEEKRLRGDVGELDDMDLEALAQQACTDAAGPPKPAAVREIVSDFKLARMVTPEQALAEAAGPDELAAARLYAAYEAELASRGRNDFDDLVAGAVRVLQTDAAARARWQGRYDRVLVDEYQDIEPAQALLVGLLAAPQDSLFCVGDEDQCIYAWRRATVRRIIELDQVYPGLERYALEHNYRCGRRITRASRRLIGQNKVRFRKPLKAGAPADGEIAAVATPDRRAGAALAAWLISDAVHGETAVLARTSTLLDEVRRAHVERCGAEPHVELATVHGAKGREWERVILYGVDEGQAPHAQALAEDGLEDERRLFYVALTRAKARLEIICTRGAESRFLREAGIRPRSYSSS